MPSYLDQFQSRNLYLRNLVELLGSRENGDFRWLTMRVWNLDEEGRTKDVDETFVEFIMQNVAQSDRERVQLIAGTGDENKAYFFDREIQQYVLQGFVYDLPYDAKQQVAGLRPFAYSRLRTLYDAKLRYSAAVKKRKIVELDYGMFSIWATMANMSGTMASDTPGIYIVSFVVMVEGLTTKPNVSQMSYGAKTFEWRNLQPLDSPDHPNAVGLLSKEAAEKIGLGFSLTPDQPVAFSLDFTQDEIPGKTRVEKALRAGVVKSGFPTKPKVVPKRSKSGKA